MKKFCPTCDTQVDVASAAEARCPNCHKSLGDQPAEVASPAAGGSSKLLVAGAAVALVAAGAAGFWYTRGPGSAAKATVAASSAAQVGWAAKLAAAGLSGPLAIAPGVADAGMRKFASELANSEDLAARLKAMVAPGGIQGVSPNMRRRHPVLDTSALFTSIQSGKALPVHSLEVAFLVKALYEARGEKVALVIESGGVTTPLLLSRTRVAVQLEGGKSIEPLAKAAMTKPQPLAEGDAVALWLVLRAHASRVTGDFKAANVDLAAAESIAPKLAAVTFAKGIMQLEQKIEEPGVANCEAALTAMADPLGHLFLTETLMALEQPVKALQHAEKALQVSPGLPEALLAKAVVLLRRVSTVPENQRDTLLADAAKLLDQAQQSAEPPQGVYAAKAQLLLMKREDQAAENQLRAAIKDHRDLESALMLSAILRERKAFDEAGQVIEAVGAGIDDERVLMALVSAKMGAKQLDQALALTEKAFALNSKNPTVALMRADLLRQNGKVKEAIAALEPLKGGPDGERIQLLQAQLLIQDGQMAKALSLVEAIRAKKPTEREPAMLQLVALAMDNKRDEAEKVAAKAVADKVLKPMEIIELWLQANDLPRAQKLLETEVAGDKPDPQLAATLAALYTATGSKDKAIALRDRVAATLGDKAEEYKKAVDQGIEAAEAEAKAMKDAAAQPGGPGPAAGPNSAAEGQP